MINKNFTHSKSSHLDGIGFSTPFNVALLDNYKNDTDKFTSEAVVFLNEVCFSTDLDEKTFTDNLMQTFKDYFNQISAEKKPVNLTEFIAICKSRYPSTTVSIEDCNIYIKVFKLDANGKIPNAASKLNLSNKNMYIPEVYDKLRYDKIVSDQDEVLPSTDV